MAEGNKTDSKIDIANNFNYFFANIGKTYLKIYNVIPKLD